MKIIYLLNKISNGEEIPKKIKYNGEEFQFTGYDSASKNYINGLEDLFEILDGSMLNDEVEILEEEKKIPEKICTNRIINTKDILEFEMIQNKINAEYTYAINEIIDFLKSKGE